VAVSKLRSSEGFTIVELLIALSVLSTILMIASAVMIQISNTYSKGVNAANLQNTTRTINADLASSLQFNPSSPAPCAVDNVSCTAPGAVPYPGGPTGSIIRSFCINKTRYSFVLNRELGDDQGSTPALHTEHVLWRDTMTSTANCKPLDLSKSNPSSSDASSAPGSGYELMPVHMRLTKFRIAEAPAGSGVYSVSVWAAYGDSDLMNNIDANGHTNCLGDKGSAFCSTSMIDSTVIRRLQVE
jgi:prepilin-type N-terminal cleavage/methylation domain-containing protein